MGMGKGPRIVQIMPGGGWLIERPAWGPGDEVTRLIRPVVAWALREDGSLVPIELESDGTWLDSIHDISTVGLRIYHPDEADVEYTEMEKAQIRAEDSRQTA